MNDFINALCSNTRNERIPEEYDFFGCLIGEWNIMWNDHLEDAEPRKVKGEWIFSRVLDGTAVQDLFIVPSRMGYFLWLYGRSYPTDRPKGRQRNYPDRKHDREDEVCILWHCDLFFFVEKRTNERKRRVANRSESNGREKIIQMNLWWNRKLYLSC